MAKKIKDLPQYMQYAYGAQPSPIAGAQLIFLNELTEMLGELQIIIQSISSNGKEPEDIKPALAELSVQIQKSITDLGSSFSDTLKAIMVRPQLFTTPITESLKQIADQGATASAQQTTDLKQEVQKLDSSMQEVASLLREALRPKEWKFDIQRHALDGHIVDVTAKSKRIGD